METPADRLRKLRARKFDTAVDAARAFGWSEHTYKSHENGIRGIKLDVARKYAKAFGSTPGYILAGEAHDAPTIQEVASVPVLGAASAGVFRDVEWKPKDDTIVPALQANGIPTAKQYALRIDGESVNLRIASGMYAICALFDAYPGGARMGALVHVVRERSGEAEHTIKEIRYTKDGMVLFPVSSHPDFQEQLVLDGDEADEVRINGVVIGAYQPL